MADKLTARDAFDGWWPTLGTMAREEHKDIAWAAFGAAWITRDHEIGWLRAALTQIADDTHCDDDWAQGVARKALQSPDEPTVVVSNGPDLITGLSEEAGAKIEKDRLALYERTLRTIADADTYTGRGVLQSVAQSALKGESL